MCFVISGFFNAVTCKNVLCAKNTYMHVCKHNVIRIILKTNYVIKPEYSL